MSDAWGSLTGPELAEHLAGHPRPVVFLVLGATEAHGPHLPLDTDTLIGVELAQRAARHLEQETGVAGLLAPPFTTTPATCAAGVPGTVHVPRDVAEPALEATIDHLLETGVERLCVVTLHFDPEHRDAVDGALTSLEPPDRDRVLYPDLTRREHAQRIGGEFATGDCHGGAFETSLVLAAAPDRVDPSYRELPVNEVGLVQGIREGKRSFEALGMPEAYCGAPAEATAERGEALYETMAAILVEACRTRWELTATHAGAGSDVSSG